MQDTQMSHINMIDTGLFPTDITFPSLNGLRRYVETNRNLVARASSSEFKDGILGVLISDLDVARFQHESIAALWHPKTDRGRATSVGQYSI